MDTLKILMEIMFNVTRTPIDMCGGSTWDYLRKLADETGLLAEDEESISFKAV